MKITTALGKEVEVNPDYTLDQGWEHYTREEHDVWDTLYRRQRKILQNRACHEFIDCMEALKLSDSGIPNFEILNETLYKLTGWRVVAVPDLVPDEVFFEHLANRRFPAADFIRRPDQLDYIQEPDVFHDVFGHVPLLAHPVFADYMEAYGKGGLRAAGLGVLKNLARLYWYTVEFGLINTKNGLRIYGSGIVSSKFESVFALDSPSPNRIHFDLERLLLTDYRIDDFQQVYFVIDSYQELFDATLQDFGPMYERVKKQEMLTIETILPKDRVYSTGTQEYAERRARGEPMEKLFKSGV